MKVLIIHCEYQYKGGEDVVAEQEKKLLQSYQVQVETLLFNNEKHAFWKLMLLPFNWNSYTKTVKKLKQYKPDIVHVHNLHFGASPSVLYAIKHSKIPFVITLHNYRLLCPSAILYHNGEILWPSITQNFSWSMVQKGVYKNSKLLTFWMMLCMQIHQWTGIWKTCSQYIALSQHAKDIFLQSKLHLKKMQITVKPNFFSATEKPSENTADYFLYVGRLSEEKGIRLLLKAFENSPHTLKIAGAGPLENEVKNYAAKNSNIQFAGSLQKEQVLSLMRNCSALLFPSLWFEGMPMTIIEAFACGVAVIASDLGVMKNMIEPHYNGLLFKAGDKNDLLQKMDVWQNFSSEEKCSYRKNAFNTFQKKYTPEVNGKALLNIYQSVIQNKNAQVFSVPLMKTV